MADPHSFTRGLVAQLQQALPGDAARRELPACDYGDARAAAAALASSSVVHSFRLGTGASVFAAALLPALRQARLEVLFVTCFWAPSKSLSDLSAAIHRLAVERTAASRGSPPGSPSPPPPPLRIRICLSSRSLLQKLLHTQSRAGHEYPPAAWASSLGLPAADVLAAAGIDLRVKSLFFLPFSVMHPKYVVVDRARAFLPSCNVSWEPWLEACVELTGAAVGPLLAFYSRTWGDELPELPELETSEPEGVSETSDSTRYALGPLDADGPGSIDVRSSAAHAIPTVVLPSPHHCNPLFHPFPWQDYAPPPPTPLNLAVLRLLAGATRHVFMQTPNVTAEAVVAALLAALARGVDVTLVTGERMMVWEQVLTAGTTTARCVCGLVARYGGLRGGSGRLGSLRISYFVPLRGQSAAADEEQVLLSAGEHPPGTSASAARSKHARINAAGSAVDTEEPVQSHAKLTIVDGVHTLLGSGNMDRASFFTSQELGILFHDAAFAGAVRTAVDRVLEGRLKSVYPPSS